MKLSAALVRFQRRQLVVVADEHRNAVGRPQPFRCSGDKIDSKQPRWRSRGGSAYAPQIRWRETYASGMSAKISAQRRFQQASTDLHEMLRFCLARYSCGSERHLRRNVQLLSTVPPAKPEDSHIANELVTESGPVERCVAMSEVYMMNRATKLLPVVLTSAIAGASIASMLVNTVGAAEECLAKPKDGAPQGQHWYYRIDRTTKRQCWYLRDKDDASSQAAVPAPSDKTPSDKTASDKAASLDKTASPDRKNETLLTRSTADAYAALSSSGSRSVGGLQIQPVTQAPSVDAKPSEQDPSRDAAPESEQSPVASRWPDPTGVLSPSIERPATPPLAVASTTPDPVNDTTAAPAGIEVSPDKLELPASSTTYSLQMLLLAAFSALAFSGLAGGTIYFARVRRRPQPDDAASRWSGWTPPDDAYRLYAPPTSQARRVNSPRGSETASADRLTSGLSENGQEIAQLLARFAQQAEAER